MLKKSWVRGGGGQGGYELLLHVRLQKQVEWGPVQWWVGGGGFRVDANEELKLL